MAFEVKTAAITAENVFTDALQLTGRFNLSISGTFVATATLQRSFNNSSWKDIQTFSTETEEIGEASNGTEAVFYRIGVKTGAFTSGTMNVRLSR